tara:strand:+ start:208 stop:732 length:525 start_codon:yes stop_codon:yes gene_type:complete
MSNLRLINETTVTSGVTSVSATDVFSSDFDIYKITLEGFYASTIDYFYLRLINSSGSVIATTYDVASLEMKSGGAFNERRGTNFTAMFPSTNFLPNSEAENYNGVFYITNPYDSLSYSFMLGQSSQAEYSEMYGNKYIGVLKQTSSITGFQLSVGTLGGTLSGGTIRTYGLASN